MEVNEAAEIAAKYLKDFFPDASGMRLEEIEKSDDDNYWFITLSYEINERGQFHLPSYGMNRQYKIFKIEANEGAVRSMKIRKIE